MEEAKVSMRSLVMETIVKNYNSGLDEIHLRTDYKTWEKYERTFLKGNCYGEVKELHLRMFLCFLTNEELLDCLRSQHCQQFR